MSNMNAAQEVMLAMARRGITSPAEVESTKQAILAESPQALVAQLGDMSDDEKVLKLMDAWFLAKEGTAAPSSNPTQRKETAPADAALTAEESMGIQSWLDLHAEEMGQRAAQSRVVCILTDRPVLAAIHVPDAKLTPSITEKTEESFKKWEDRLVDTPENRAAFAEMKAAFMKKEPMEVYINPDAKERAIGYTIETTDSQGQPQTLNLTKEAARDFLLVKVQGVIQARGEDSIGIRVKWTARKKPVSADNEANAAVRGTTSVTVLNRKALQNNPSLSRTTCVIAEVGGQKTVNNAFNAKTARYFEILTDKTDDQGKRLTRKQRLSGKTAVYNVERREEYVNDFGPAVKVKGTSMSKADRRKVHEAVINSLADMRHTQVESNELRSALAQINRGNAAPAAVGFN